MEVEVAGIKLVCEISGEGPDVVILHGWVSNSREWKLVTEQLAKTHKVWLINLPGFGGSDELVEEFDLQKYAKFVELVVDELKIESYTLIGHSFGGRIAMALAATDLRVKKLVLVDAAGMAMPGLKLFIYGWLLKLLVIFWNVPVIPKKYLEHLDAADVERAIKMMPLFSRVVSTDLKMIFPDIKVPVLVVWGLWDVALPVWEGVWLYKSLSNARFRLLPYSTHVPHVEEAKKFVEYLREFGI